MAAVPPPIDGDGIGFWAVLFAGGSLLLTFVMNIVTLVWSFARNKTTIDDKITDKDGAIRSDMTAVERRMQDAISKLSKDCGEMGAAIRQKVTETDDRITQTELWNRDNFVKLETYRDMQADLRALYVRFDQRFDQLERKLDGRSLPK